MLGFTWCGWAPAVTQTLLAIGLIVGFANDGRKFRAIGIAAAVVMTAVAVMTMPCR